VVAIHCQNVACQYAVNGLNDKQLNSAYRYYTDPDYNAAVNAAVKVAISTAAAIGPGFPGLKTANPVGSALKNDPAHRAAAWVRDDAAEGGAVFKITGGDGVQRTLIQIPGEMNGVAGRFEYIVDQAGNLTHEMFVEGGSINGEPIKP
jgi:hypothetical protein